MANYNSLVSAFSGDYTSLGTISYGYTTKTVNADWFQYHGVPLSKLYLGSDCSIGINSNEKHLRFLNADHPADEEFHKKNKFYYKEGTLYNKYRFLSCVLGPYYASSNSSPGLEIAVMFLEPNLILIKRIYSGQLSLLNGRHSFEGKRFTLENSNQYFYVFHEENGEYQDIEANNYSYCKPDIKYLLKKEEELYTISEGVLTKIEETEVTSALFQEKGFDTVINREVIDTLEDFEILCWSISADIANLELSFESLVEYPIVSYSELNTIPEDSHIEKMKAYNGKELLLAFSFDNKETWKYFANGSWQTTQTEAEGMSYEEVENITEESWQELQSSNEFYIKYIFLSKESQGEVYFNLIQNSAE